MSSSKRKIELNLDFSRFWPLNRERSSKTRPFSKYSTCRVLLFIVELRNSNSGKIESSFAPEITRPWLYVGLFKAVNASKVDKSTTKKMNVGNLSLWKKKLFCGNSWILDLMPIFIYGDPDEGRFEKGRTPTHRIGNWSTRLKTWRKSIWSKTYCFVDKFLGLNEGICSIKVLLPNVFWIDCTRELIEYLRNGQLLGMGVRGQSPLAR